MDMVPIIVENNNVGVAGLYILLLVISIVFLCLSLYARRQRVLKLLKAKRLIEEGHAKKKQDEEWENE